MSDVRVKRYNLVIPEIVFAEVQAIADERQTSVVDILRRFIKLGIMADGIDKNPDASLVVREGDIEKIIILL